MTDLSSLLARVETATGAERSRAIFREMLFPALRINEYWRDEWEANFCDHVCDLWDAGGKLDAVIALCERVLGAGWHGSVEFGVARPRAYLTRVGIAEYYVAATTPAIALLAALLRAKMEERE